MRSPTRAVHAESAQVTGPLEPLVEKWLGEKASSGYKERVDRPGRSPGPWLILCAMLTGGSGGASIKPTLRPHAGPHGGTLVSVPGAASVEIVYDCAAGKLGAYVLDPHGVALRIKQPALHVQVTYEDIDGNAVGGAGARVDLDLEAVAEKGGAGTDAGASQFSADSENLRGVCHFLGSIERLEAEPTPLRDIPFRYPGP